MGLELVPNVALVRDPGRVPDRVEVAAQSRALGEGERTIYYVPMGWKAAGDQPPVENSGKVTARYLAARYLAARSLTLAAWTAGDSEPVRGWFASRKARGVDVF